MLALYIIGAVLGYLGVGYGVGAVKWNAWQKGDPTTLLVRFFFPGVKRFSYREELWVKTSVPVSIMDFSKNDPRDAVKYKLGVAVLFPCHLVRSCTALLWIALKKLSGKILDGLVRFEQLLSPPPSKAALPSSSDAPGAENLYLDACRREAELRAKLEDIRAEMTRLETALGPDEAKKLAALPGKKL